MDLREISIFKNLSDQDLEDIKKKTSIEEKTFTKGEHIFRVGEVSTDMYYLISGSVTVYKIDPNGKRFIIKTFNKPAIFGEVYAYLSEAFDFSAEANEDSKIAIIRNIKSLFSPDMPHQFLINYINMISKKCLELSKNNQVTSQATLRQKIANYLLLNQVDGTFTSKMSRDQWADILATTRPSLSRELSKMADDGLISLETGKILISDLDKLRNIL